MIAEFRRTLGYAAVLVSIVFTLPASAAAIPFWGNADSVMIDNGTGIYTGASSTTIFSGSIDDITGNGEVSDTTITTPIICCVAAGVVSVSNNVILDGATADLLNLLAGASLFSDGDLVDGIDVEGDTLLPGGGRLEAGVSWVFTADTFADDDPDNYPFAPNTPLVGLFFILEADADGEEIFQAFGSLQPVPLPAAWLLFVAGCAGIRQLSRKNPVAAGSD